MFMLNNSQRAYTSPLSLPDALPILMDTDGDVHEGRDAIRAMFEGAKGSLAAHAGGVPRYLRHHTSTLQIDVTGPESARARSEEHTSELQSLRHLVCRLLLERKKTRQ